MNISKNWGKEQQAHKSDDTRTKRQTRRQKRARGMTRSNEGIARRAYQDTAERRERWGFTTFKAWVSKTARKRRHRKQRAERKRKHAARILRNADFAAKCKKRYRDYTRCRLNSCHNVT
jgi:hypothetical protein